jgi:uncharacterized membrane protein
MPKAKDFFTTADQEQIIQAIREAEKETSGEIRVHLEEYCKEEPVARAAELFAELKMTATAQRNGVLFYLALADHKFAIYGDTGINEKVPEHFWEDIRDLMQDHFKAGRFTQGLSEGIVLAGQQLKAHFPYHKDDKNELDDSISYRND